MDRAFRHLKTAEKRHETESRSYQYSSHIVDTACHGQSIQAPKKTAENRQETESRSYQYSSHIVDTAGHGQSIQAPKTQLSELGTAPAKLCTGATICPRFFRFILLKIVFNRFFLLPYSLLNLLFFLISSYSSLLRKTSVVVLWIQNNFCRIRILFRILHEYFLILLT
jgi:hypothetical protein